MSVKQVFRLASGVWSSSNGGSYTPPFLSPKGRVSQVRALSTAPVVIPPPPPPTYARPTGSAYTRYEDLPSSGLQQVFNAVPSGQQLTLPAGTFAFSDFANGAGNYGILAPENCYGWAGNGIDSTVFDMTPGSSTKAGTVPIQSTGSTNQLSLMRAGITTNGAVRGPIIQGFTLAGTDQPIDSNTGLPHTYNGLQLFQATGAQVSNIKITGIPGNSPANPGETFSINDYRGVGNSVDSVEIDGRKANGTSVAATLIGLNYVNGFSVSNSYLHHSGFAYGTASFSGSGTLNWTAVRSEYNTAPFNFEQNVATINMRNCIGRNCRSQTTSGVIAPIYMIVDGNRGSSVVNIYDPVTDYGTPTPSNPLIVVCHSTYGGVAATQQASDIHLYLSGVERRDCLRIATNETLPPAP